MAVWVVDAGTVEAKFVSAGAVVPELVGPGVVGAELVGAGVAGAEDPVDALVWNHARICSRPGPAITPVHGYGRQSPLQKQTALQVVDLDVQ